MNEKPIKRLKWNALQVLEERDKQIETLKKQLEEVSADLDANAVLMDDVRSELHKSSRGPGNEQMRKIAQMQSSLRNQQDQIKDAEQRAQEVNVPDSENHH